MDKTQEEKLDRRSIAKERVKRANEVKAKIIARNNPIFGNNSPEKMAEITKDIDSYVNNDMGKK